MAVQYAAVRFADPRSKKGRGGVKWYNVNDVVPAEVAEMVDARCLHLHETAETEGYPIEGSDTDVAAWIVAGKDKLKRAQFAADAEGQRENPRRAVVSYTAEVIEAESAAGSKTAAKSTSK